MIFNIIYHIPYLSNYILIFSNILFLNCLKIMSYNDNDGGGLNGGNPDPPPANNNNAVNNNVSAVSVKVPPFWKANPALWFCQLEAQFENSRITVDRTMYNAAVMSIDSSVLSQVSDIVLNPPNENKYLTLKNRLLERYTDSDTARLKKLLTEMTLGDKKPSHLLREMRENAGSNVAGRGLGEDALKSLWLQRLSTQCQAILSTSNESLENIATMADKIYEVSGPEICSISSANASNSGSSENSLVNKIDFLCQQVSQIDFLSKQVAELKRSRNESRSDSRNRRFRSRSKSHSNVSDGLTLCWYHTKFNDKAYHCKIGCKFYDEFSKSSKN